MISIKKSSFKPIIDRIQKDSTNLKTILNGKLSAIVTRSRNRIIGIVSTGSKRPPSPYKNKNNKFENNWEIYMNKSPRVINGNFFFAGLGSISALQRNVPYYIRINDGFLPPVTYGYFGEGNPPIAGAGGEYFVPARSADSNKMTYKVIPKVPFEGFHYFEKNHLAVDKSLMKLKVQS